MHFTILKENLGKALSIVGRGISTKPQLPILSHIHIKAEKSVVTLSATNLELGIVYQTVAKIEKEGVCVIAGKLLQEFVGTLSTEKIEFSLDGTTLTVQSGKTKAVFSTMNSADFPPFPQSPNTQKKLPFTQLKEALMRTTFAASVDETRPVLTGVKVTIKEGRVALAATDGYRLSMESVVGIDKKEDFQLILPASSLSEVVKIALETKADEVGFAVLEQKNQVMFSFPEVLLFTRLIDGEFPSVDKIIPTSFKTKVTVDKEALSQSVKTASLFARGAANIVKIKITKDGLHLSANAPQVGSDEDFVEAKVEGEESEIAFNFRFLLDLLAHFPNSDVVFESSGALTPGVFKSVSPTSTFLHLIMPVRVQN